MPSFPPYATASRTILVTGGAGFIGSALVRHLLRETVHRVVNVDKLTYAGNLDSLEEVLPNDRYAFEKVDICDAPAIRDVFERDRPDAVMHLATEIARRPLHRGRRGLRSYQRPRHVPAARGRARAQQRAARR